MNKYLVVAVLVAVSIVGCAQKSAIHKSSGQSIDHKETTSVSIGSIDLENIPIVKKYLKENGVESFADGSVVYSVEVYEKDRATAIRLLAECEKKYKIRVYRE